LGLFAPMDITWSLVEDVATELEFNDGELPEARKQLNNLYLIKAIDEERTRFAVHSLTRKFLQWKLAQEPDTNCLFRETFVTSLLNIAKTIPSSPTQDLIVAVALAIPHLDMLSREMLGDIPNLEEDHNLGWAFAGTARFYAGQGLYALAKDSFQRCLKATKELLGVKHLDVAGSLNNLALLHSSQGRYAEAEPLLKQALVLIEELLGDKHPDVATSINNLATLYLSQGRYAEAEPLLKQALVLIEELLGDKHPDVATSINNLATLYRSQERYKEAEPLHQQALTLRQELLGDKHPDVATSINNLATLYLWQGRYEEAEPLYQQALALRQELLGDKHPHVAHSLNNLALLYSSQGRYEEAESKAKAALAIFLSVLGENNPRTLNSLLSVKGLRVQNLLQCDTPTVFAILEDIAQHTNITTLDTEAMLYLLEAIATNPELLQALQQSMSRET